MAYRYDGRSIIALQILRMIPQLSSEVVFTPPLQPLVVWGKTPGKGPCERLMVWTFLDKDYLGTSALCGFQECRDVDVLFLDDV